MIKVIDLFSGIGGFSLGLERAGGFETIQFVEQDAKARQVLSKHWPGVPQHDDIRTYQPEEGSADLVCGGFPCQDISSAGRGVGIVGERSGLWSEMARVIGAVRPKWVIAENVSALRSRGLALVLQDLCSLGYDAEWHCIPASAIGAPHRRDRVWVIAYRNSDSDGESALPVDAEASGMQGDVAHPAGQRSHSETDEQVVGGEGCNQSEPSQPRDNRSDWWQVEPALDRVAHGVPGRVDRLKQLGNSIVPQIAELIGAAILRRQP